MSFLDPNDIEIRPSADKQSMKILPSIQELCVDAQGENYANELQDLY